MRVAAIYDIHGMLPALEAVLADVRQAGVDLIVVGGDVVPGPWPRETLERLLHLDTPTRFIYGNGEFGVLAQMEASGPNQVTYWGTTSGFSLPKPLREVLRWTARQMSPEHERLFKTWPLTVSLNVDGLGDVLFCHATPRNETEILLRTTSAAGALAVFAETTESMAICGHTHMQFDRMVGPTRVVNAGSVGMPFGQPGADWLLLGPEVELRHTTYDLAAAADLLRRTAYPQAEEAAQAILTPPPEAAMLALFRKDEVS